MQVKIGIRGVEQLVAYLKTVPRGVTRAAMRAFSEYILGNQQHGLRHSEPYKYVSRKAAYGQTFKTDKQRRWFFANNMQDKIGNNRTGKTAAAWTLKESNNGYRMTLENKTAGGYYTRSDKGQARQLGLVGWRKLLLMIAANVTGALRSANAAVNKWLKGKR